MRRGDAKPRRAARLTTTAHHPWSARDASLLSNSRSFREGQRGQCAELAVEAAGEHPLEGAERLPLALAGCELAFVVDGGLSVQTFPGERDPVQRAVQLAVAAAVEPVASGRPARGLD